MIDLLTPVEREAMRLTTELSRLMCGQIIGYGSSRAGDVAEFVSHVHAIQQQILSQAAARAYPDEYRLLGDSIPA